MIDDAAVSARIRRRMRGLALNQRQLSARTNLPYDTLSAYLTCKRRWSAAALAGVAAELGTSLDILMLGRPVLDRTALLAALRVLLDVHCATGQEPLSIEHATALVQRLYIDAATIG